MRIACLILETFWFLQENCLILFANYLFIIIYTSASLMYIDFVDICLKIYQFLLIEEIKVPALLTNHVLLAE